MDSKALVEYLIEDGEQLVAKLIREGFKVIAACWLKTVEHGRWVLFISSPKVDEQGSLASYRVVQNALRSFVSISIEASAISVIGEKHPITTGALSVQPRLHSGTGVGAIHLGQILFGGFPVEEVYVYSPEMISGVEGMKMQPVLTGNDQEAVDDPAMESEEMSDDEEMQTVEGMKEQPIFTEAEQEAVDDPSEPKPQPDQIDDEADDESEAAVLSHPLGEKSNPQ